MYHQSLTLKTKHFFLHHEWLSGLLIFCIAAIACTVWIAGPVFSDPDSFYHIKITELMIRRHAAITEFPWLTYTTLSQAYVDHHLLYHIILIPFVLAFNGIIGIKVATVLLFASCIALFWCVLRSFHVRFALAFSLFLLFTNGFAFRLSLAKAPSVGFLFLISGFALLAHKKYRLLSLLSFFFVWAYGGFLLLPILAALYASIHILRNIINGKPWSLRWLITSYAPLWVVLGGTLAGLLIHPSFPAHFQFYWQQIIQIGFVNYRDVIGVGGEWYPTPLSGLLTTSPLLTSLLILAVIAVIRSRKPQSTATWATLGMTGFFFLFTLKSQRYIEYYIPWGYLSAALLLHGSGMLHQSTQLIPSIRRVFTQGLFPRTVTTLTIVYITIIIPGILITDATRLYDSLHQGVSVDRLADAGVWLREHSTAGDILFQDDWDVFPILFYRVTRLRYIVGLDPTFMYNFNRDLYWKWVRITTGEEKNQLLETIQQGFHARFVLIDSDHTEMYANIIADGRFSLVYSDDEASIFRVPRDIPEGRPKQKTLNAPNPTQDQPSTP